MIVEKLPSFKKSIKKLHGNQLKDLERAIRFIIENPKAGELKRGDLASLRVYKFKMVQQLMLLGYTYTENKLILSLVKVGPHENFYRDMKNIQ